MPCTPHETGSLPSYKYVVVLSVYQNKLMLSKHKHRTTWETQGGHIEPGETPIEAARRELFEESGATEFDIRVVFDYRSGNEASYADGQVFLATIKKLDRIPHDSEMELVEFFDRLPHNLTYPDITPVLFGHAKSLGLLNYED